MRLTPYDILTTLLARARRLRSSEEGFTMLMAMGVFITTTVLVSTAFVAAQGDTHLTQHDLNSKRAYYGARAGANAFLHRLNRNSNYWQTCPTQAKTDVPGSGATPGSSLEQYSYKPLPNNPPTPCSTSDPIGTMIDQNSGSFRMQFSGYSGNAPQVERHFVASFRRDSPLDYLWYTVYETLDPYAYDPSQILTCSAWHRTPRPSQCGNIDFITADNIKGPMYTQDQFALCGNPTFGRTAADLIKSADPRGNGDGSLTTWNDCSGSSPNARGTLVDNAGFVPLPTYNTRLMSDAQTGNGLVLTGPTIVRLAGPLAYITNADAGYVNELFVIPWSYPTPAAIIYAANGPGCDASFDVRDVDYDDAMTGNCGDIYVYGPYSQSLTIGAENDITIGNPNGVVSMPADNVSTDPDGPAILGLVANNFVRVMHGCDRSRDRNDPNFTRPDLEIDAAILALAHSFIVDNYGCGSPIGRLIVTGAIAQKFRGIVGTHSGTVVNSGYVKDYTYDDRLRSQQPPYMFDIQNASWHLDRETPCQNAGPDPVTAC